MTKKLSESTTKDEIVKEEIKQIKKFLLKNSIKLLMFTMVIIIMVSAISYFFWKENEYLSKLQLSMIIGISTLIYLLYYFLKPMFFTFQEPEGVELSKDTPLYSIVDELVKTINTPKINKIFLVSDLNASVMSYRTWTNPTKKHYLSIGIQLIAALSLEEMKSIIAHELGHISKNHAGFSNFIYRIYIGLKHYEYDYYSKGGDEELLQNSVYAKFTKDLDLMSYNLKRNNEHQADEIAGKATSPQTTASALCRVYYVSEWSNEIYWDNIWKNCWKYPVPQVDIIVNACKNITKCVNNDFKGHFDKVKITKTKKGDTHPSLKDRVEHLNVELKLPEKVPQNKLAIFTLGDKYNYYLKKCDEYWQNEVIYEWQDYHEYMASSIMRRDLLLKTKLTRPLLNGEYFELARLEEIVNTKNIAMKRYYETYQNCKLNYRALFEVARLMLTKDSRKAEAILIKIMNRSPDILRKSAELLAHNYDNENNLEKYNYYKGIMTKMDAILKIRAETSNLRMIPHGLSDELLKEVITWLNNFGGIYWAMLFQLKPEEAGMPDKPNYIFVICCDSYLYGDTAQRLLDGLFLNGTVTIIDAEDDFKNLAPLVNSNYKEGIILGKYE